MAFSLKFDHEGDAFTGHSHINQSRSFGMESKKLNKLSADFSYDLAGVKGKISAKNDNLKGMLSGGAAVGHFESGYSADFTSKIPKIQVKAGADLAKFSAEAKYSKHGMEHKVAELNASALGASVSGKMGGNTVLPVAKAEAHTLSPKASAGIDNIALEVGVGEGPGASMSLGLRDLKIGASNIRNGLKNTGETIENPIFSANASDSSFGKEALKIGDVSVNTNGNGEINHKVSIGMETPAKIAGYKDTLTGKSGVESGTWNDINVSSLNRKNITKDAEKLHNKNDKLLRRVEEKRGLFTDRTNNAIADKSGGYVDRLNSAINEAQNQRLLLDHKLSNALPKFEEAEKLSKQSQELENEINRMIDVRNHLAIDRDRANANLGRNSNVQGVERRSTDQIVTDARINANKFESSFKNNGMGNHLADPAVGICNSRNELNGRINELNRRLEENDRDLINIGHEREEYLKSNDISLKDAVDRNDTNITSMNTAEKNLREENKGLRSEKAECQKALLETDKNFAPKYESEDAERKERELQAKSIDNKNAQAAKDDEIANHCNSNGIEKDSSGNYVPLNNQPDQGLQSLLNEKANLENEGKNIQNDIFVNKRELSESEKDGKTSLKVAEKDGNAVVDMNREDYKMHAQDNKNLRDIDQQSDNSQQNSNKKSDEMSVTAANSEKSKLESDKGESSGMSVSNVNNNENDKKNPSVSEMPTTAAGQSASAPSNTSDRSHSFGQSM